MKIFSLFIGKPKVYEKCDKCNGFGQLRIKDTLSWYTCPKCKGLGKIEIVNKANEEKP